MPSSPTSNPALSLSPEEERVLGDLKERYFCMDLARQNATNSEDVVNVVNAVRQQRDERLLAPDDLPRIKTLEKSLIAIARDPFSPLPQGYATFVNTVDFAAAEKLCRGDSQNVHELYERGVRFASYAELLRKLEEAVAAFPALSARLAPTMSIARSRVALGGAVYLFYSGCSIAGSPTSRAEDDAKLDGGRLLTNLANLWKIGKIDVWRVNLPGTPIDPYAYRGVRALQLEEHTLISVRWPHCLNSAPGGYTHEFAVDRYPANPLVRLDDYREDPSPTIRSGLKRHFEGFAAWAARQPGGSQIASSAIAAQIEAAVPRFTIKGRTPVVAVAKDITVEEYEGRHAEIDYRGRLAGPGPQATSAGLLYQNGIDSDTATSEDRLRVLPPCTDLYLEPTHWWIIAVILLRRFLSIHGWPAVIWTESGAVAWAFRENALAKVEIDGESASFYCCQTHDPRGTCTVGPGSVPISTYAGEAFISNLGGGRYAIVLANLHRGAVKYDPELAQDRWHLQLAADAAHQCRIAAYLGFIASDGYPHDLASAQRLHDAGEAAVPAYIKTDLAMLRQRVADRTTAIISIRMRSAALRGSPVSSGPTSEFAREHRSAMYQKHEKAEGNKSDRRKRIADDPARLAQFDRLLAEQQEMESRRLPDSRHPCRPQAMDVEQWKAWFLQLDRGIEIVNSAAQFGKHQPVDGQQYYQERLAA